MSAPASIKSQYRESFVYQFNCSLKISMLVQSTGQFDLLYKQSSILLQTQKTFSKLTLNKTHSDSLPYGYQASYNIKKLNRTWVPNQETVLDTKDMNQCNRKKELRLLVLEPWGFMAPVTVSVSGNIKSDLHLYFYLDLEK